LCSRIFLAGVDRLYCNSEHFLLVSSFFFVVVAVNVVGFVFSFLKRPPCSSILERDTIDNYTYYVHGSAIS
jgi:hypothetical protein